MAARTPTPRGFSLIEVMVSMVLLLICAAGASALAGQGAKMNGDGRRMTRATAIAQDLVSNIDLWPYTDARLANLNTVNDADIGDQALAFETQATPPADHDGAADLTPANYLGVQQPDLDFGGYQRFWNVSVGDDWNGNGTPDVMRIAVIVRWPQGGGFRRIVLFTTKVNPADVQ